jgi:hypothetical protein
MNMSTLGKLTRTLVLINMSFMNVRHTIKKKRFNLHAFMIAVTGIILAGALVTYYVNLLNKLYHYFYDVGIPTGYLLVFIGIFLLLLLLAATFFIVHLFFYSNDYQGLLYLPVKPEILLTSKLLVALLLGYLLELVFLVPALCVYGFYHLSIFFIVAGVMVFFTLPVIALTILALIMIFSLKMAQIKRRVNAGIMGFSSCLLVVVLASLIPASFLRRKTGAELLNEIIELNTIDYSMILVFLVGLAFGCLMSFFFVAKHLFSKGFYRVSNGALRERKPARIGDNQFRKYNSFISYFRKEWYLFFREPVYVLNGLFSIIIPPFLLPLAFQLGEMGGDSREMIREAVEKEPFMATLLALGVIAITSAIHPVASSCVSREGRYFWICRIIPIPFQQQVLVKLAFASVLACCGLLMNGLVFLFYFGYSLKQFVIIFTIGLLFIGLSSLIGVLLDTFRPKLNWVNRSEAIKQNVNVVLAIFLSFGIIAIFYKCLEMAMSRNWGEATILSCIALTLIMLNILFFKGLVAVININIKRRIL